jgi:predicted MFS family arabinose efflux permease
VVVVTLWRVPESRGAAAQARLDWPGAALATAGLLGLVFGLIRGGSHGFAAPSTLVAVALGVAALVAFAVVEWRVRHPMLPPALFASRTFSGVNLLTLFLYAGIGATMFVLPFNLIEAHGYNAIQASAALLPFVIVMFLLSRWSGGLMDRYGSKLPLTVGPAIAATGFVLFAAAARGGSYWTAVFPAVMVMSLGMAITVAPLTTTVMTSVAESQAGLASGVNNAVSRVAMLLSVAAAGLLSRDSFAAGLAPVAWMSAGLAVAGGLTAGILVENRAR